MKSIIAIAATLFFAASAAPVERAVLTATISLSDNQSGAQGNVEIPLDGRAHSIGTLWQETSVYHGGAIRVTSAAINGGSANHPECIFRNEGEIEIGRLYVSPTYEKTYLKFGSSPDKLEHVDLATASITCSQIV